MNTRAKNVAGSLIASCLLAVSASASAATASTVMEEITVTHPAVPPSAVGQQVVPWSSSDREEVAAHLGLNTEQRQEIRAIFANARPELDELREQRRSNRDALDALDVSSGSYVVALQRLTSERGELVADTDDIHERVRAEVGTVLTQTQQIRLADLLDAVPGPALDSSAVQIGTDDTDAD